LKAPKPIIFDTKIGDIPNEVLRELYRMMLKIQKVELQVDELYHEDEMKTPVHLCIGQEAVAVGICAALKKDDYISSNHRGHGHYLAKGGDLKALIAELHCRKTGCSKGYGGSMHLVDVAVGHLGSSSIVGGGIPIGTGLGLAIQMKNSSQVSTIFFGDGAADEGVLYESINFAMLKRLPVVFVLENNQWAVCSHVSVRQPGVNIFHRAEQEMLFSRKIDGNSVMEVYDTARLAIDRARTGGGPSFIECNTYRILGHAGCGTQDPEGYRDRKDVEEWKENCPVRAFLETLIDEGTLTHDEVSAMEKRIEVEIEEAFLFAKESPLADQQDLYNHIFCE